MSAPPPTFQQGLSAQSAFTHSAYQPNYGAGQQYPPQSYADQQYPAQAYQGQYQGQYHEHPGYDANLAGSGDHLPTYEASVGAEHGGYPAGTDMDPDWKGLAEFADRKIRAGFIRKVYAILSLQLLVTFGTVAIFVSIDGVQEFVQDNPALLWVAYGLTFVLLIAMVCVEKLRRQTPWNYIMLGAYTLCMAYLVGTITTFYDVSAVLYAVGVTAIVTIGVTIFAFQTKYDITDKGGYLLVALLVLLGFGIFAIFFRNDVVNVVYAALGALLFTIFLVYDTQLMLGGKHKMAISPEEYILAALNLYVDIINLFLYILALFGNRN
eukprot:Clim_evm38s7 gene=Clim_evmTU38s7